MVYLVATHDLRFVKIGFEIMRLAADAQQSVAAWVAAWVAATVRDHLGRDRLGHVEKTARAS